jgi:tRNA (guanine-N7-)-methyltransferase
MRIRRKSWSAKQIAISSRVINQPQELIGKWKTYFENNNNIYLEIGSGKGGFILQSAALNPSINYIATEREVHAISRAIRNINETPSSPLNLAFIVSDASNLTTMFDKEISRIYINFCDPWPNRKKWHKRRLTHQTFLNIYKKILKNNAQIHLKTDNKELFDFSLKSFNENNFSVSNINYNLHNSCCTDNVLTEYEKKFVEQGLAIYRCEAKLIL